MKNLNDILTIIALFVILYFSIRVLFMAVYENESNLPGYSRIELLRSYRDNEED